MFWYSNAPCCPCPSCRPQTARREGGHPPGHHTPWAFCVLLLHLNLHSWQERVERKFSPVTFTTEFKVHWFILQLLRTHHLGWKIRRSSRLKNLLNLSEIWAMHICNSLSLNKRGKQPQRCLQTHSLLCWRVQGLALNQAGVCRANSMQTKNSISKLTLPNWKILSPP